MSVLAYGVVGWLFLIGIYGVVAFHRNTPCSQARDRERDPVQRLLDRFNRRTIQPGKRSVGDVPPLAQDLDRNNTR